MALEFTTGNPRNLLTAFKNAIDQGHVVTWSYDKDGDFTHTATQWKNQAWMRPKVVPGGLRFMIVAPNGKGVTWEVYGIYHGRLAESVIIHCHELFATVMGTAEPAGDDKI